MANVKSLTVVQVTPMHSKKDNTQIVGYKHKLQSKAVVTEMTPFGQAQQGKQETYYMTLSAPCNIGFSADMNLDQYNVVEKEFEVTEGENKGKKMFLKNIFLKGAEIPA